LGANEVIVCGLKELFADIGIVSEENSVEENFQAAKGDSYFMIDPLDGTRPFIRKSDEFSVNIALIEGFKAVFGVIYMPVQDIMYFTDNKGKSFKIEGYSKNLNNPKAINVTNNKDNLRVICTKREPERSMIIEDLKNRNIIINEMMCVSSSYKFCLIGEGKADLYPRKFNIKAWDIAAGHAIVSGAGGRLIDSFSKEELSYDLKDDFEVPFFEVF
jgi:3'(2'), 5'-bisphosphate nucleotidase